MAKQSLPSVDDATMKPPSVSKVVAEFSKPGPAPIAEGYVPRRVDVKLPMKHRMILHKKLRQLQDSGARLEDGTEVSDKTKAVLWILENEVDVETK